MFSTVKTYLVGILAGLAGLLALLLKLSGSSRRRAERRAETAEAKGEHLKLVQEKREEHAAEFVSRSRKIAQEIEEKGYTKELSEKDEDW